MRATRLPPLAPPLLGRLHVDCRKSKDRQVLLKCTIDAFATGEVVALFPEGTSYTVPRTMRVKDGAAWATLEPPPRPPSLAPHSPSSPARSTPSSPVPPAPRTPCVAFVRAPPRAC